MASLAKPTYQGSPSLDSLLIPSTCKISGLIVGEDVALGDACYIKSDGKIWRSIGTSANAAAKVRGYAATPGKVAQRDAVTLLHGVEVGYPNSLNPGSDLYLDTVAGGLSTTATTGGTAPIGFTIDVNRIFLFRSGY